MQSRVGILIIALAFSSAACGGPLGDVRRLPSGAQAEAITLSDPSPDPAPETTPTPVESEPESEPETPTPSLSPPKFPATIIVSTVTPIYTPIPTAHPVVLIPAQLTGSASVVDMRPACVAGTNSYCGLNYSGGYDQSPDYTQKVCRITYFAPNTNDTPSGEAIFYTNCGTCREAVLNGNRPQSFEGPIFQASGRVCSGTRYIDEQRSTRYAFRVETLNDSSCQKEDEYFTYQNCTRP